MLDLPVPPTRGRLPEGERAALTTERTSYGYRVTATGQPGWREVVEWQQELRMLVRRDGRTAFALCLDLRGQRVLAPAAAEMLRASFGWLVAAGMGRCAAIVDSALAQAQWRRVSGEPQVGAGARCVYSRDDPSAEARALAWLARGVEPG